MNFSLPIGCTILVLLSSPLASCSRSNPLFCDVDTPCALDDLSFCDVDKAFPGTTLENECIARPSPGACNAAQPCEGSATPKCTDESSGICVQCTEADDCSGLGLDYCDTRVNECTDEVIVSCVPGDAGDAQCAALSESALPFCGDEQVCVACTINEHCSENVAEAVCDQDSFTCRGCEENAECDSRLCGEGTCAAETSIVYVDTNDGTDGVSCGTQMAPCATIATGLGQTTPMRDTVLVATGTYGERIELLSQSAQIIGEDEVVVRSDLGDSETLLHVGGTAQVSVENITFEVLSAPATSDAILCDTATAGLTLRAVAVKDSKDDGIVGTNCALSILGSTISGSSGIGIEVAGGTLTLHDSHTTLNARGGVSISEANYSLVNNIITLNGGAVSVFGGVRIESTTERSEELSFNTIAQNSRLSSSANGVAMRCEATSVVASNNIFMLDEGPATTLVTGCSTQFSLFDTGDSMPTGPGNISADALFVEPEAGNFHLQSNSPGIDVANPTSTLETDIDGEARPVGDGPDMGADEVQ